MTVQHQQSRLRIQLDRRKLKIMLPLLVLLLAGLGYGYYQWQLHKDQERQAAAAGMRTELPDAQFKEDDPQGKMAYYDRAKQDSARMDTSGLSYAATRLGFGKHSEDQTLAISRKLEAINREINSPAVSQPASVPGSYAGHATQVQPPLSADVSRLEGLMKSMLSSSIGGDPELDQLNAMMDKIMQIQNPAMSDVRPSSAVSANEDSLFMAVPAEIARDQKVTQGAVVEIRLLDTVFWNGQCIPKGQLVFGLANFSNQRLQLDIKNVRLGHQLIPVKLRVYDQRDAMLGVYAPEALLAEAVASGSSSAMGGLGISGLDLGSQLAGAGIDAARSLLSRKIKRIKQPLKAGYPLLIRDDQR